MLIVTNHPIRVLEVLTCVRLLVEFFFHAGMATLGIAAWMKKLDLKGFDLDPERGNSDELVATEYKGTSWMGVSGFEKAIQEIAWI